MKRDSAGASTGGAAPVFTEEALARVSAVEANCARQLADQLLVAAHVAYTAKCAKAQRRHGEVSAAYAAAEDRDRSDTGYAAVVGRIENAAVAATLRKYESLADALAKYRAPQFAISLACIAPFASAVGAAFHPDNVAQAATLTYEIVTRVTALLPSKRDPAALAALLRQPEYADAAQTASRALACAIMQSGHTVHVNALGTLLCVVALGVLRSAVMEGAQVAYAQHVDAVATRTAAIKDHNANAARQGKRLHPVPAAVGDLDGAHVNDGARIAFGCACATVLVAPHAVEFA